MVVVRRFQNFPQSLPPAQLASLAAGPHWHLQHLLPWLAAVAAAPAAVLAGVLQLREPGHGLASYCRSEAGYSS